MVKKDSRSRDLILPVRVTFAEKEIFHLKAKEAGFEDNVSAFIRKRCGIPTKPTVKFKIVAIS